MDPTRVELIPVEFGFVNTPTGRRPSSLQTRNVLHDRRNDRARPGFPLGWLIGARLVGPIAMCAIVQTSALRSDSLEN
jgi:hypothetical protein